MRVVESYEEWRVFANVHGGEDRLDEVVENVRARTEDDVDVHRRNRHGIAVYAFTEAEVRHAERVLVSALDQEGLKSQTELTRWNPGLERWQDPSLPIELAPTPLEPAWVELGELAWEVRVVLQSRGEARRVEQKLRAEGYPTRNDGRRRLAVGVSDQAAAAGLTEQIA